MTPHSFISWTALALGTASALVAAEPTKIVFTNGRSVPLSAVSLQADKLVVTGIVEGFTPNQALPLESADHVYGDKPMDINAAVVLLLTEKPADALRLLEPIVSAQRVSAKIPGNFWLEAARAAVVGYALQGNGAKAGDLVKEISDATPAQGLDAFAALSKALSLPPTLREAELKSLITDSQPPDVCAYASFFRGLSLNAAKKNVEALEAFLAVPNFYSTGGMAITAVAELRASELLAEFKRKDEALALVKSSIIHATGTSLLGEANKRLDSLK